MGYLITSLNKFNNQNDGSKELKSFNIFTFLRPTIDGRPRPTVESRSDSQNDFGLEPLSLAFLGPLSLAFIASNSSKLASLCFLFYLPCPRPYNWSLEAHNRSLKTLHDLINDKREAPILLHKSALKGEDILHISSSAFKYYQGKMHGLLVQVHYPDTCVHKNTTLMAQNYRSKMAIPLKLQRCKRDNSLKKGRRKFEKKSGAIGLQESLDKVVEVAASSTATLSSIRGGMTVFSISEVLEILGKLMEFEEGGPIYMLA
ncbi:hypothetical protein M9H77_02213 [Catharanthus roseus]|uniref:Uncharacterized protein n=1 Tax=Catharanthus roseus TaxID=4058 RepID=A0ACC0C7S6_CATRO|nr:hypothetical protein M9H77_02213 [Catharanthus roseus]